MNDRLYGLIEKMSQSEKAHFQKFGFKSSDGGKPERALFEIIRTGLQKDSSQLDKHVKNAYEKTGRKDFIRMRARLFNALIASISDHDRLKHDVHELSQLVLNSRVLAERGFHREARKLLAKGKNQASGQQKPHWELLFEKEHTLIETKSGSHASIMESLDGQLDALDRMKQLTLLAKYYEMAFQMQRSVGMQRDRPGDLQEKLQLIEAKADELDLTNCPPSARFNRIMIKQVISHTLNRTEDALRHTEDAFQLLKATPEMSKGREQLPVAMLSNLINDGISAFQFQYFNTYMGELRNWKTSSSSLKLFRDGQVLRTEANEHLYFGQFDRWNELLTKLTKHQNGLSIHVRQAISGQVAHMMFADGAFKSCIRHITSLFHDLKMQERQDLSTNLEILLLAAHFELDNMTIIEQLTDSLSNRKKTKDLFTSDEIIFIKTFKKLGASVSKAERKHLFTNAAAELQDSMNSRPLGFFNPTVWILAKMNGERYADALKRLHGIDKQDHH